MKVKLTKKFLKAVEKGFKVWEEHGGKFTTYKCGYCKKEVKTRKPKKAQVDSRGFWDSSTTCILCGGINFVVVYPSGKTKVEKM